MLSSADTIKKLQQEVLQLRLQLFNQENNQKRPNLDETKRDLIAELLEQNTKLRQDIQMIQDDVAKPQLKDAECQTALDGYNMDELFKANLTLKRQKCSQHQKQQSQQVQHQSQQTQHPHPAHVQYQHQFPKSQHDPPQPKSRPIVSQLLYPHVTPSTSTKNLLYDEKETLEKLFKLDGLMTIIRDKMRLVKQTN